MAKTVLITGASRGIGRAAALAFAGEGYQVCANYNTSRGEAEALVAEITHMGGVAIAVQADISDPQQAEQLVDTAAQRLGSVSVLVNNAGISASGLLTEQSTESWQNTFAVNCHGMFYCTRRALPAMIARGAGCILNISSIWGLSGASCEVAYSASKGAVIAFTRALAKEVGPSGIRVNCVAPGVIDTEMNAGFTARELDELKAQTPLGRLGSAKEIAGLLTYLASESAAFITGQVISPNGGFLI